MSLYRFFHRNPALGAYYVGRQWAPEIRRAAARHVSLYSFPELLYAKMWIPGYGSQSRGAWRARI
ncbi:MAG TPA: hypothetical protein VMV40_08020 [Acidiferrobacter sp.]|nr:hypothetical protein [Acidiferrobacter sp.]